MHWPPFLDTCATLRLNEADQQSLSRDVFRAEAPVQHAHISYKDTQRSAVEWMDDTARTARLEKLQQKLPPTLKTKIRQGDVKAADASRDIAEAKSKFERVCVCLPVCALNGSMIVELI